MTIYEKLGAIQQALQAPKSQFNSFGNYKYRSCEDVLAAVKPLLSEYKCVLLLRDDLESKEGRVYIKATATLVDIEAVDNGEKVVAAVAFAREEESKKGMDASQVTGAASSYARKYALNGLFCIDDNKDSDFTNRGTQGEEKPAERKPAQQKVEGAVCRDCGSPIPGNVLKWSTEKYGMPLCRDCQKRH